jgi:hypothetical protein
VYGSSSVSRCAAESGPVIGPLLAGAWPQVIGCPGLETVSLFVPKRDRVAALMSWRQGGWVIGRTD